MSFSNTHDLLDKIIHLIPGNVYWKDIQGHYLGCNDNQLKIARLSSLSDIIGKTDFDLYQKELAEKVHEIDQYVMSTGKALRFEEQGINEKGVAAIYLTDKQPLYDEQNKICGLLGVSIDITEKKMAEEIQAIKSAFIQNIEHDLRTPAGGISGIVDMLYQTETDPVRKETLGLVAEAAKELLDYQNRIIKFSQMEAKEWPIVEKPFSIRDLLEKVIALEKPAIIYKKLKLKLFIDPKIPTTIISDDHRWYCIAVNLISNAVKFTEVGQIEVKLNSVNSYSKKQKDILELKISDTGIGISKEKQILIDKPFNRLNPSNQNKYKGLGLGLPMVKQFLNELNGEFKINSTVNKGTVISCFIPIRLPFAS